MMKNKCIITIASIILSCNVIAQEQKKFTLTGTIDEKYNNDTIMLFAFKDNVILSADTTVIDNRQFYFEGTAYTDELSLLSIGNYPDSVVWLEVMLEEGNIEVSIGKQSRVGGSPLNDDYQEYSDSFQAYYIDKLNSVSDTGRIADQRKMEIRYEYQDYKYSYKKRNSANILGRLAYLKDFFDYTDIHFDDLYNNVFAHIKDDPEVQRDMAGRQAYYARQKTVGQKYIDFELETPAGGKERISGYVGKSKYLFVDFWASWCGPCIADMPHIKKVYEKYKDKGLNVLAISLDDRKSDWQRALKRVDAPWDHLRSFYRQDSEIKKAYDFIAIPYAILLDEDGTIVAVNQRGISLEYLLEGLLKE